MEENLEAQGADDNSEACFFCGNAANVKWNQAMYGKHAADHRIIHTYGK